MNKLSICIILVLIILVLFLLGIIIYKCVNSNNFNNKNKKLYEHLSNTVVVLFKTHTWNDNIEYFVKKIKNETVPNRIDFYILMHSDDQKLINQIKDQNIKKYVLVFSETDIKKTYRKGFYSMWLSNHWILMWFFKQFKNKYQYYWSVEYDVRISGNGYKIWNYLGTEDFIYPVDTFKNPQWTWKNYYVGGKLDDTTKWYGYLQLARYSKKFLDYLDKHYEQGENGQDELITFSLFNRGKSEIGLTGTSKLLGDLIKNSWSVDNSDSDKHKQLLEESESKYKINHDHLLIFHPVKY
ncbi:hypothetical protein QJ857_gp0210 [Tupanvirus soda lake]|uniref:Uncharacterized protein n=2 Tax=Tupanvirus TaxID=2094720 RepID=A0A6N1NN56_9VIRU|nr:hypothetical protein QJ857_gp0210 [Tupanvirus soda lake]QKU35814.1 hypothetical protein [Tupanvirus soda lake]